MSIWFFSHFVGFIMRWLSYGKNHLNQQADYLWTYWRSGLVTRVSGLRPGGCKFNPRPSHTKNFQNGIICSFILLSALWKLNWSVRCQYNVTGWNVKSCVWGVICQWGSSVNVSIELPVTSRTRHDINVRLLKATLGLNKIRIIIKK